MRRIKDQSIDMTPLLDVVFILIFALIMNVSISKAEDQEKLEAHQEAMSEMVMTIGDLKDEIENSDLANVEAQALIEGLEDLVDHKTMVIETKNSELEAISEIIKELITDEMNAEDDQQNLTVLSQMIQQGDLAEAWLKYEQIADKYLFVDLKISNENGRIYIDDVYTTINIEKYDAVIKEDKEGKVATLSSYLYNWLDHKEGGYSFVFVTVTSEDKVSRAAINLVFEALGRLQPSFDQDYYMINKYVTYE
jgi:biopolymer transport protein ExbD